MGILNVTPDSFSGEGRDTSDPRIAGERALKLIEEGAEIVDIGGESTRPGAAPIPEDEEMRRVLPVIQWLRPKTRALLSIDTFKSQVAAAALDLGVDIINDITSLSGDERMGKIVAQARCGLVLMHMQGTPTTMQKAPYYQNVVSEVAYFLRQRREVAIGFGIDPRRIVFDPGIGFGKTFEHNRQLLAATAELANLGAPLMIGHSRKSFLSYVTGTNRIADRLAPSLALTEFCRDQGARIFRVHDVQAHRDALRMTNFLLNPPSHLLADSEREDTNA